MNDVEDPLNCFPFKSSLGPSKVVLGTISEILVAPKTYFILGGGFNARVKGL